VRAKGLLCFAEEPSVRAVLNLSGRRRCSFEHGGLWSGPAQQHLVLIGTGLQSEPLLAALRAMEVPTADTSDSSSGGDSGAAAGATAGAVRSAECSCDANDSIGCSARHTCTKDSDCNHSSHTVSTHSCCSDKATCVKHEPAATISASTVTSSSVSGVQAATAKARALIDSSEARGMYEWLMLPCNSDNNSSSSSSSNSSRQQCQQQCYSDSLGKGCTS
jgi:hypothetical protein